MITEHVNRIPVHLDGKTIYDIVLEDSFDALAKEISALGTEKKKICIIADSNVSDLYLDEVTKILPVAAVRSHPTCSRQEKRIRT